MIDYHNIRLSYEERILLQSLDPKYQFLFRRGKRVVNLYVKPQTGNSTLFPYSDMFQFVENEGDMYEIKYILDPDYKPSVHDLSAGDVCYVITSSGRVQQIHFDPQKHRPHQQIGSIFMSEAQATFEVERRKAMFKIVDLLSPTGKLLADPQQAIEIIGEADFKKYYEGEEQ